MLDNCCYDKIKLMHDLSALIWFIKKHAYEDAQKANDKACIDFLNELENDLGKHLHALKQMACNHKESCSGCKCK
jgi:hypothetical protein